MLSTFDLLLLDIEGTITAITFVKDVLFPYVRRNLRNYLETKWDDETLQSDVKALSDLSRQEFDNGDHAVKLIENSKKEDIINAVVTNVNHWMDEDKKLTALKLLQGHMWRDAYQSGEIKGHLFPDVIPVLRRLVRDHSKKISIYSSGSVEAQKLLFRYSCEGDVTDILQDYFDTRVGGKTEPDSYAKIASHSGVSPEKILFLTDLEREAYAAKQAGVQAVLVIRDGNAPLSNNALNDFPVIRTLNELIA